jgi:nucleolar complex protein 2
VDEDLDLGQNKVAKTHEVEDEMDVDSFLEKGFFDAMDASDDENDGSSDGGDENGDEESAGSEDETTASSSTKKSSKKDQNGLKKTTKSASKADPKDLEDEMAQHRKDLEELKKDSKQAAFLEYLAKESPGLLEEMEDLDGDKPEGMDVDEEAADDSQHPILTIPILELWKNSLMKDKSVPALKRLANAFRVAVHMNSNVEDAGNPEESRSDHRFSFRIADPTVFNEVIVFVVSNFSKALNMLLGKANADKDASTDSKVSRPGFQASRFPKWIKLKDITRGFLLNLHFFLSQLSDAKMLTFVLQNLEPLIKYLAPFASIEKKYLKLLLNLWSSSTESVRIFAFFCIRKMALELPYPFIDNILKGIYLTYVRNCKFVNRTTIPLVNFLCNCVVEIYGLDFVSSYQHAFVYIRELASHLRNSFTSKKKETRKSVYNFQFINSINAWVRILAAYPGEESLSLLYYPLVQLIQGTIAYQPTNRYFPLRLRCVQMLNTLALASKSYVNAASYLLEILASPDMFKRPKQSMEKALDLRINLKASKAVMGAKVYQDTIFDETFDRLVEYLAIYSRSIAFPELILPVSNALSKFKKATHNPAHSKKAKLLQDKILATVKLIQAKRNQVSFSPKEIASVSNFLGDEPTPLSRLNDQLVAAAAAAAKAEQAAAAKEQQKKQQKNGGSKHDDEDDEEDLQEDGDSSSEDEAGDDNGSDSEASELEVLGSDDDVVQEMDADMISEEEESE